MCSNFLQVPEKNKKDIAEAEAKMAQLETKKKGEEEKHQSNLTKLNEKTQPLRAQKEKLQEELGGVEVKVNEAKSQLTLAESEMKLVKHNETKEKAKFNTLEYDMEQTKEFLCERQKLLKELEESIPKIKNEIGVCNQKIEESKTEEKQLGQELRTISSIVSIFCIVLNIVRVTCVWVIVRDGSISNCTDNSEIVDYFIVLLMFSVVWLWGEDCYFESNSICYKKL